MQARAPKLCPSCIKLCLWARDVTAARFRAKVTGEGSNPSGSIRSLERLSLRERWRVCWAGRDPPQSNLICNGGEPIMTVLPWRGTDLSLLADGLGNSEAVCIFRLRRNRGWLSSRNAIFPKELRSEAACVTALHEQRRCQTPNSP